MQVRIPLSALLAAVLAIPAALGACRIRRDPPPGALEEAGAGGEGEAPNVSIDAGDPEDAGVGASAELPASDAGARALPPPRGSEIVAIGGLGSDPARPDESLRGMRAALEALAAGDDALDAAARGVVALENDPRVNAGVGSRLRLDGSSVQMDAAVMDGSGHFGAVAAVERVKNPVLLARVVARSPHPLLVGDAATALGRREGMPDFDPTTPGAIAAHREAMLGLEVDGGAPRFAGFDWRSLAGDAGAPGDAGASHAAVGAEAAPAGGEPVAVLVRSAAGRFAAAASTGGGLLGLPGRMGHVPVPGDALQVGVRGAVVVSGDGDRLLGLGLARRVYEHLVRTGSPEAAAAFGQSVAPPGTPVGIAVLDLEQSHVRASAPMAFAVWTKGAERTSASAGGEP